MRGLRGFRSSGQGYDRAQAHSRRLDWKKRSASPLVVSGRVEMWRAPALRTTAAKRFER